MRFWHWTVAESGMVNGGVYIVRGLKRSGDQEKWGYVPREDGAQTDECNFRTTVEDVSRVESITMWFQ